jgi:hypothetical protein
MTVSVNKMSVTINETCLPSKILGYFTRQLDCVIPCISVWAVSLKIILKKVYITPNYSTKSLQPR